MVDGTWKIWIQDSGREMDRDLEENVEGNEREKGELRNRLSNRLGNPRRRDKSRFLNCFVLLEGQTNVAPGTHAR